MATMGNTNREGFGNVADGQITISHYAIVFRYGTGAAIVFISQALETPRTLAVGEPMEFPVNSFVYTLPSGDGTSAGAKALIDAMIAQHGNPTILLGTGAMGDLANANEVTDSGYARQIMEMTTAL